MLNHMEKLTVVTAENIFGTLKNLGVKPWEKIGTPMGIEEYLKKDLSEEEKKILRFAPKIEVASFKDPNGNDFRGFRSIGKHGAVVFALLPDDLLPICAEFRHGTETISLNLPGGTFDKEAPQEGAKREFEEETGIALGELIALSPEGTPIDARLTNRRNFSFLGIPRLPLVIKEPVLDRQEFTKTLLIPLADWLTLITENKVEDSYSTVSTFLALRKLKRI